MTLIVTLRNKKRSNTHHTEASTSHFIPRQTRKRKASNIDPAEHCCHGTITGASTSRFNPRKRNAIVGSTSGGESSSRTVSNQDEQENDSISGGGNNPTCDEVAEWMMDLNKNVIEPDHGSNFKPNPTEVVHTIVECMTSKYDQPWTSWKKVPQYIRDMWFDKFQKVYQWHPQHSRQIRKNFETRGSIRLKNIFNRAREIDTRPIWMDDSVWKQLQDHWNSESFKAKSEQAKKNRASDVDGLGPSCHTGGSIPMTEHKRRLEAKTGKEVLDIDLFLATHQKKDQTWVDIRSAQTYEKWTNAWKDMEIEITRETSESQSVKLTKDQLWAKNNITKKGNIYGLGAEGGKYKKSTYGLGAREKYKNPTHGNSASSSHMGVQLDREKKMDEEIEALRKENVHQTEAITKMGKQMQEMMKMLADFKDEKKKKKKKMKKNKPSNI